MYPTAEADLPASFTQNLTTELERVLDEIWNGTAGLTDAGILKLVGSVLQSQVIEGYGKNFMQVDWDTPDAEMLTRLTRDVWNFSAAKNYQQMRDMTLAMRDENGKLRSFGDFKDIAGSINEKYNSSWLRTEYNQAIGSATMAARWSEFEANKKIMPFLQYSTVGDKRVRDSHRALEGIIRKIDDQFWATHYPPNGWGCRCSVNQLPNSNAKETKEIPDAPIPAMFRTNLAQSGLIFPAGHPYYDGIPTDVLRRSIQTVPADAAYNTIYKSENGKTVQVHLLHGIDEMAKNVNAAKLLADAGYNVKLLPILDDDKIREKIYGTKDFVKGKNPDALINGKIFDIKTTVSNKNAIHNSIKRGQKQADGIVIHLSEKMEEEKIRQYVKGQMTQSVYIDDVWVINKEGNPLKYNRKGFGLPEKSKRPTS